MTRSTSFLAALLLGACATAGTTGATIGDPTAEQVDAKRAASGDKLICRTERPVGSNMPVRNCRWASDEKAQQSSAQEALRKAQPNTRVGN